MRLYCGIDLHSNNCFVTLTDENDRVVFEKRLPNDLEAILKALEPFREAIVGIVVESTYNWYWLVDGLMEAGFSLRTVSEDGVRHRHMTFFEIGFG